MHAVLIGKTLLFLVFVLQAECKISFELFIKKSDIFIRLQGWVLAFLIYKTEIIICFYLANIVRRHVEYAGADAAWILGGSLIYQIQSYLFDVFYPVLN